MTDAEIREKINAIVGRVAGDGSRASWAAVDLFAVVKEAQAEADDRANRNGAVAAQHLERAVRLETALASIQWGSCDGCGAMRVCPECLQDRERVDNEGETVSGRHLTTCSIAAALGLNSSPTGGSTK